MIEVEANNVIEEILGMNRQDMLVRCQTYGFKKSRRGVTNKLVLATNIFRGTMGREETDEEYKKLIRVWGFNNN